MNDDYLWDGSGEPDPDVKALEERLSRFRHQGTLADSDRVSAAVPAEPAGVVPEGAAAVPTLPGSVDALPGPFAAVPEPSAAVTAEPAVLTAAPPTVPARPSAVPAASRTPRLARFPARRVLFAIAAAVVLCAGLAIGLIWMRAGRPFVEVARLSGAPTIGARAIGKTGRLAVGERLATDDGSRARIDVGLIGQVELEPATRVLLTASRPTEQRLKLEEGTIHAKIWAPPRLFQVDVPSAVAVDLGCAYTLTVAASGQGLLHVTQGWVAFDAQGRESFVPQGAQCATRPGTGPGSGPGTPYREDVGAGYRAALALLDFDTSAEPAARAAALDELLAQSRERDALTLWHLLSRTQGAERERVYERFAELVPPPKGVEREGVLAGDQAMLDAWWNELGLNSASFWRLWEGNWPPRAR